MTDPLTHTVTAQVRDLHACLQRAGMLTPPPRLGTLNATQAARTAADLRAALAGVVHALDAAPHGSALTHYRNALLFGGMIAAEAQRIEPRPVSALCVLSVWAAEFRREALHSPTAATLDALDGDPQAAARILQNLDARERGAVMGAGAVLAGASWAVSDAAATQTGQTQHFMLSARMLAQLDATSHPSAAQA